MVALRATLVLSFPGRQRRCPSGLRSRCHRARTQLSATWRPPLTCCSRRPAGDNGAAFSTRKKTCSLSIRIRFAIRNFARRCSGCACRSRPARCDEARKLQLGQSEISLTLSNACRLRLPPELQKIETQPDERPGGKPYGDHPDEYVCAAAGARHWSTVSDFDIGQPPGCKPVMLSSRRD